MPKKEKLHTKSSTEADLLGTDDASSLILWTEIFWKYKDVKLKTIFYIKILKVLSY